MAHPSPVNGAQSRQQLPEKPHQLPTIEFLTPFQQFLEGDSVDVITNHKINVLFWESPQFARQDQVFVDQLQGLVAQVKELGADVRLGDELRPQYPHHDLQIGPLRAGQIGGGEQTLAQRLFDSIGAVDFPKQANDLVQLQAEPLSLQ